jgi:chitinase
VSAALLLSACGGAPPPASGVTDSPAATTAGTTAGPRFGAYIDTTSYPVHDFAAEGPASKVLGFIVASPTDPCLPSWGGYYSLDEAESALRMDARIASVRGAGGDVMVSFGGAARDELATVCADGGLLVDAYRSVVERYGTDAIDLDIEYNDLLDSASNLRRAEAMATLQRERSDAEPLEIWLTLPVKPGGLTADGVRVVSQWVDAGVKLAGVNIMVMDFGGSKPADVGMAAAAKRAALATHGQLADVYGRSGSAPSSEALWAKIGLTPMIGQNDVREEVFDLGDAAEINRFALAHGLGRLSYWSQNRDRQCGSDVADPGQASDLCSGVDDEPGAFGRPLGAGL